MIQRQAIRQAAVPAFLLASLLLGGSTRSIWPNLLLQVAAIALVTWAALVPPRGESGAPGRRLALLMVAMVVIVLLQLIPLPPAMWTALPGRSEVVRGFDLLGQPLPWLPLSLTPYETISSALWLLVPIAAIVGILRLNAYRKEWLALVIGVVALANVALGTMQSTSGNAETDWYLYPITNVGSATGFFANSNHLGTLLFATIPFMVAALSRRPRSRRARHSAAGRTAILGAVLILLVIALILNGSLAAIGLGVPVLAASLLGRAAPDSKVARSGIVAMAGLGLLVAVVILAGPVPNNLYGSGVDQGYSSRQTSFANSLRATAASFPVGTGSGSFPSVYPAFENPDIVDQFFVNHVHNDYIELVLETGLAGLLLIVAFFAWWIERALAIWRAREVDAFARAATIASAGILAHSLVDFPLRTSAIAAVFGVCIALMAAPRSKPRAAAPVPAPAPDEAARHLSID